MKTKYLIHPEWLATTLTRFRNWVEIGFKIHVYPDGSYEGEVQNYE